MPTTASKRLYGLLDSLVALQMEFANGTDGDKDLSPLGRAKVLEVRLQLYFGRECPVQSVFALPPPGWEGEAKLLGEPPPGDVDGHAAGSDP
jgi:hypothetical protein